MKYGSLFSGACDGIGLGLEWAAQDLGIPLECAFQVEIDPWCRKNLEKLWPNAERYSDIRNLSVSSTDILVGGFPCQDLSVAGKGKGLAGKQSGLWFEYLRIIQEARPKGVIIENVPGLIRRGLDVVVSGLTDAGYTVEGTRIQAADVGAPHRRERVVLIAYPLGLQLREQQGRGCGSRGEGEVLPRINGEARNAPDASGSQREGDWRAVGYEAEVSGVGESCAERSSADSNGMRELQQERSFPGQWRWTSDGCWIPTQSPICRRDDGVPRGTHGRRLKALGNAAVPQCMYIGAIRLLEQIA